jgi:4a-hydroxytetrahydrobiopterin dehydratase
VARAARIRDVLRGGDPLYVVHGPSIREEGRTPMSELAKRRCVPCQGGVPALKGKEIEDLLSQIAQWQAVDEHHLTKTFRFADFARALAFVNEVAAIAEAEGHHPDVYLTWGRVRIDVWTHKIDGLTESDFVLAAKIDEVKSLP